MKDIPENIFTLLISTIFAALLIFVVHSIPKNEVKIEYRDTCMTEYKDSIYWNNIEYQDKLRNELLNFKE